MKQNNIKQISFLGFLILIVGSIISAAVLVTLLYSLETLRKEQQVTENAYDILFELKYNTERLLTTHDLVAQKFLWKQNRNDFEESLQQLVQIRGKQSEEFNRLWGVIQNEMDSILKQLEDPLFQAKNTMDKSLLRRLGEGLNSSEESLFYIHLSQLKNSIDYLKQYETFFMEELTSLRTVHLQENRLRLSKVKTTALWLPGSILLLTILLALYITRIVGKMESDLIVTHNNLENSLQELMEKEEMMLAQSRHAAMGEMISMIAHQWRQPITVIAMGANNLLADVELENVEPEEVKKSAAMMLEQSHHLSKTIDDFKNFFRPNKKTEMTLVNDVLEENFSIVGKSLENHNIAVEKEYGSQTPIAIFSRELLQVFINIFKNAKEALIEDGIKDPLISVATREDEEHVYISICDNGKGIDPAILAKIYDPYFSTKGEKNGTGLGLYMSKTIIEKHLNGVIKAENRKEGGICFEMALPKKGVDDG
ncbi:MAG: HAMP domain-containing sensor histidine kinase [Campylobacterota bacterium]|nr:HAMP domain-containing sensor histidine kinase [Campylobacterota bacterium]